MKFNYDEVKHNKWTLIIKEQEESKLNITEYCKLHNINRQRFYVWKSKLLKRIKSVEKNSAVLEETQHIAITNSSNFIKLRPKESPQEQASSFILEFGDKVMLRIDNNFDSCSLQRLLVLLKGVYA